MGGWRGEVGRGAARSSRLVRLAKALDAEQRQQNRDASDAVVARRLERIDAAGMPIVIENEVFLYINSIKINLPETLGTLSAADRQRIAANHGSPWKKSRMTSERAWKASGSHARRP